MSVRLSAFKTFAVLAAAITATLLFAWLALPGILKSQAEKFIAEKTGHRLVLERPAINPFALSLRLPGLRLEEPDGKPLLAFRELTVDLSIASAFRRALVFDAIRLDAPEVTVAVRRDGRLNWAALLDTLESKESKPDAALPRLDIRSFALAGGRGDFHDEKAGFDARIETLDLELSDISTLADDNGRYKLSASTAFGARIHWQGEATLKPMATAGRFQIENLDLARLAPYLKDLPVTVPAGVAAVSAGYKAGYAAGRLNLAVDEIAASLSGLKIATASAPAAAVAVDRIEATRGRFDLASNHLAVGTISLSNAGVELPWRDGDVLKPLRLGALALDGLVVDLAGRRVALSRVALKDGHLRAAREQDGIDVLLAAQALRMPGAKAKPAASPGAPWHYEVAGLDVAGFSAALRDAATSPAAELALEDIALSVTGIGSGLAKPLPVRAALRVRGGGAFEAAGEIVPATPAADLKFKLAALPLKPAQPYLSPLARLTVADGRLDVDGRVVYGKAGLNFTGRFAVNNLRLDEADSGQPFLAWKSLGGKRLEATPTHVHVGELAIDGLDTSFIVHQDKSTNLAAILKKPAAPAADPAVAGSAAPSPPPARASDAPPFAIDVERLRLRNSEMDFADLSLALPFNTRIHRLRGVVSGLSSRPGPPAQLEFDGEVDDYGMARAVGQIDLFRPTHFTDVKVVFRNVEMTRLTPYAATFAGRKIASGKLSLDLEYKIDKRQLAGENQVIMDQLTLGERVDSPTAKSLPLDLAIAVLQDADGRIDLGLPVSGSLDDPQFSYGGIVWKAIVNVIGKIATAPFRALGALFGGGDKFESVAFEAGAARLTPPEREKMVRLAGALAKRPGLALTVHGAYAEADRVALQERQLRRAVAERAGQRAEDREDPGPLSTRAPKIQAALESLFADRFGADELQTLREAFRAANPGQLEESAAGKIMSRLTGLLRERRPPDEQEVARLKGADFHAVLYERLRRHEAVADDRLRALAAARGEQAMAALKAAGAPDERLSLGAPGEAGGGGRDVPIKLVLGAR